MWPFKKKVVDTSKAEDISFSDSPDIMNKASTTNIPLPPVEKKEKLEIVIYFRDNSNLGYNQEFELNSGKSAIGVFIDFYRWFYERESPAYTFKHKLGADIIIRSEIIRVSFRKNIE